MPRERRRGLDFALLQASNRCLVQVINLLLKHEILVLVHHLLMMGSFEAPVTLEVGDWSRSTTIRGNELRGAESLRTSN